MQGIEVSAMIVWTIYKDGDGPMKAYKFLGDDLVCDEPRHANALINTAVSAIVRNHIANSEIMKVIKERDTIRDLIMESVRPIAQGWGIYLETVEITDVKICSKSVFSDMQCEFREIQNREATSHKIDVDHEISLKKADVGHTQAQRNTDTQEKKSIDQLDRDIITKKQEKR